MSSQKYQKTDKWIADLCQAKDFTIKPHPSKNRYSYNNFFYSTYILGNFRNNKTCAPEKTEVFWEILTSKYFHIVPIFSYAKNINKTLPWKLMALFPAETVALPTPLHIGTALPQSVYKDYITARKPRGPKALAPQVAACTPTASLLGGRSWLMALCSLLDTNSMGH